MLGRIDRMRDAPIAERQPHIRKLAELDPKDERAAHAQRVCLSAYEKLQAAHDAVAAASDRIAKLKAEGKPPRHEEITAADRATTMMREAESAEPACAAAVAELKRKVR